MRGLVALLVLISLAGCGDEERSRVVTVPKAEVRQRSSGSVPAATAAPRAIATH